MNGQLEASKHAMEVIAELIIKLEDIKENRV